MHFQGCEISRQFAIYCFLNYFVFADRLDPFQAEFKVVSVAQYIDQSNNK